MDARRRSRCIMRLRVACLRIGWEIVQQMCVKSLKNNMANEKLIKRGWHKWGWFLAGAVILLSIIFGSRVTLTPHYVAEDERATIERISDIHALYNSGNFQAIYGTASEILRKSNTVAESISGMSDTFSRYGSYLKTLDYRINTIIGVPVQIRVIENSEFAKGRATEMVIFVVEGNKINLAQYQVSPGTVSLPSISKHESTP